VKWLTDLSIAHPIVTLAVLLVLTVGAGWGIKHIEADPDVLRDLPDHLPAKELYDRVGEMFPSKEMVFIGLEADDLWTPERLADVAALTRAIEEVPVVQQVLSPTNASVVVGTAEGFEIRDAATPMPTSEAEAVALRDFLLSQESTRGTVVSADGEAASIMVFLQANLATTESKAAGKVAEAVDANVGGLTVYKAGRPMVTHLSSKQIGKDTGMLTSAALLLMLLLLGVMFANVRGVLLPIGVTVAAVLWTMGGMGWIGIDMTHSLEALPIMLIAIGVADGVHIVQAFMDRARRSGDRKEAARMTMDDLRRPVILTSITTAVGFLALNTSGVRSIAVLGGLVAFGTGVALLFSLTMLPAVLALLPVPKRARRQEVQQGGYRLQRLMVAWGELLIRHKAAATAAIGLFVVLCIVGATQVKTETSVLSNFPGDDPIRMASDFYNDHFGGVTNLQVVFEGSGARAHGDELEGLPTRQPNYGRTKVLDAIGADAVKDPAFLREIEEFETFVRGLEGVGGTTSVLPIVRSMNQVLHAGDPAYNRLPGDVEVEQGFDYQLDDEGNEVAVPITVEVTGKEVVAGYFGLLEMSGKPGDLANFVTDDYRAAKVTVFLDSDRKKDLDRVTAAVTQYMDGRDGGVDVEMTGMAVLMLAVNDLITRGQTISIGVSLLLVFVVTSLMFRSPVLGACNAVPLFAAIFFNFGVMGLAGLDLNLMTMGVASMAIGVGVDFAIHFVHRYRVSFGIAGEPRGALKLTMEESGVAILMNMVAVAGGFLTLLGASFKGVVNMGLLISLIMAFSAVGALTILPLLFTGLRPKAAESHAKLASLLLVLGAGALVALPAARSLAAEGDARAFMEEIQGRSSFDDMVGRSTLTLVSANGGTKVREFRLASRDNDEGESDMIMIMESPADMRGNGFLMLGRASRDDERYIYVPALRRVNKIVGTGRGGAFMSSDFSIDDIGRPDLDEWTWTFAGTAEVDGHACRLVEATPVSDEVARETGYTKVVWYVDEELKISRAADYFDKQGLESKHMQVHAVELLDGVPFATDMTMTDEGTGHSSRMTMTDLVVNGGADPTWFTNRTLQNGF